VIAVAGFADCHEGEAAAEPLRGSQRPRV